MDSAKQNSILEPKKNPFTTVTTLSKILALALFVSLPFIGFYLGINYQKAVSIKPDTTESVPCPLTQKNTQEIPSSVPSDENLTDISTATEPLALKPSDAYPTYNPITGWKIYQNPKYNFEIEYPKDFYVTQEVVSGKENSADAMYYIDLSKYKPNEVPQMEFSGIRIVVRNFTGDLYEYAQEDFKNESESDFPRDILRYDPKDPTTIEKTTVGGLTAYLVFDTYHVSKNGKLYSINNGIDDNLFKQILPTFRFIQ